jgi:hypothetical protein
LINIHSRMGEKGHGEPRAAYGMHFGDGFRHNESGLMPRETLRLSNLYVNHSTGLVGQELDI